MWLAILLFVGLSVEVLSYLSGEQRNVKNPKQA